MNTKKTPDIILLICFALWFLIFPLIIGIKLYKKNSAIDAELKAQSNTLENQINNLKEEKNKIEQEIKELSNDKTEILNNKSEILSNFQKQAEEKAKERMEIELNSAKQTLEKLNQDIENQEKLINEKSAEYEKSQKNIDSNIKKIDKLKEICKSLQYAIQAYDSDSNSYLKQALNNLSDETLLPVIEMKLNCMNVKQLKSKYNMLQKDIQEAFKRYEGRYSTKANIAIYKLMVIALEAELQNVLYSLKYGKLEDSVNSVKEITSRYLAIAVDGNQSIAPTMKKFIAEIEYLFIEAIKVEYEYYTQKERIKEEQRALKEQMRQEAEERKILEAQKKQVEKEEAKYKAEIDSVNAQLQSTSDSEQLKLLEERIKQLQQQLEAVNEKKEDIIKLQNGKAGYVYIISNLGSFGENVFKVGMTRRQEPMDRVKELGDASVPFSFDVHSFIFSEDAVSLENTLHKELNNRRVNKINLRKEFFSVSIDEIENLVYKYQPTAEFNRTMLAEEYHQGLSTTEEPIEIDYSLSEDE